MRVLVCSIFLFRCEFPRAFCVTPFAIPRFGNCWGWPAPNNATNSSAVVGPGSRSPGWRDASGQVHEDNLTASTPVDAGGVASAPGQSYSPIYGWTSMKLIMVS